MNGTFLFSSFESKWRVTIILCILSPIVKLIDIVDCFMLDWSPNGRCAQWQTVSVKIEICCTVLCNSISATKTLLAKISIRFIRDISTLLVTTKNFTKSLNLNTSITCKFLKMRVLDRRSGWLEGGKSETWFDQYTVQYMHFQIPEKFLDHSEVS